MDTLEKAGLVRPADRREFLSNALVVVVPADSATKIASADDLVALPKVALADPAAVPAGVYAKKWLTGLGLWEKIEPKVVPTLDVRAALAAVESGAVPAAVVYRTDAAISKSVRIAYTVDKGTGDPLLRRTGEFVQAPERRPRRSSRSSRVRPDARSSRSAGSSSGRPALMAGVSNDFSILLLTLRVAVIATLAILPFGVFAALAALARARGPCGRSPRPSSPCRWSFRRPPSGSCSSRC